MTQADTSENTTQEKPKEKRTEQNRIVFDVDPRAWQAASRKKQAPRPRRRLGCFVGDTFRSPAHMLFVRTGKERKKLAQERDRAGDKYSKLANAWDAQRLREGDCADRGEDDPRGNRNQFHAATVLRFGWRTVGLCRVDREGLDGVHGFLLMSCGVAGAVCRAMRGAIRECFGAVVSNPAADAMVIRRHYDTTPWRLQLGRFHEQLFPIARYPLKDGDKWRLVDRNEYLKVSGHFRCVFVLVFSISVAGSTFLGGVSRRRPAVAEGGLQK